MEDFDRVAFYVDYYRNLSPSAFGVERDGNDIIITNIKKRKKNNINEMTVGKKRISESFKNLMKESQIIPKEQLRFNNGIFNKKGANTIYWNDNPIVDFGVGALGTVTVNGESYENSIYLQGGYNASEERRGYGENGIRFIFNKLPKIQNLILQCYPEPCGFWRKMGGKDITSKEMPGGKLTTMVISRSDFDNARGLQ
jgi:hypothetical protein